jgi:hypothetical protein
MRFIVRTMACVGVLVTLAGCDPVTDRAYMNEGAGVDLYTSDRAQQAELLNQYLAFICGPDGSFCGNNWATVVYAGMNDIDQRCDGFLTWLDAKRRDKEPILAQLGALTAAAHSIMTVTGSSPKSLDILTAAFGLATASYTNWNSRLLISVNQSTVQQVVYKAQGDFRTLIKSYVIRDQPTAVYLLRNYLRLCMPITIEASINVHTLLVLNDAPDPRTSVVVATTTPPRTYVAVAATDISYTTLRRSCFQTVQRKPIRNSSPMSGNWSGRTSRLVRS